MTFKKLQENSFENNWRFKIIAKETMNDTAKEIHENPLPSDFVNITVLRDGTWQRIWFSSYNGVFAAISVENGKVSDIEPTSRYWKGCNLRKDFQVKNPSAYAERKMHVCQFKCKGSAGVMEAEGAKCIFERSIDKNVNYDM